MVSLLCPKLSKAEPLIMASGTLHHLGLVYLSDLLLYHFPASSLALALWPPLEHNFSAAEGLQMAHPFMYASVWPSPFRKGCLWRSVLIHQPNRPLTLYSPFSCVALVPGWHVITHVFASFFICLLYLNAGSVNTGTLTILVTVVFSVPRTLSLK